MQYYIFIIIFIILLIIYIMNRKRNNKCSIQNTNIFVPEEDKKELQKEYLNFKQKEMLRTYYLKYSTSTNTKLKESKINNNIKSKPMRYTIKDAIAESNKTLIGKKHIKNSSPVIDIEMIGLDTIKYSMKNDIVEKNKVLTGKKTISNDMIGNHKELTGKKTIKNSFVVIDIETTGLHSIRDEIIEIGAVKIEDINSIQHKTFQAFIKPKKDIPYFITNINGITNNMVKDADSINDVLKDFLDFIEDYPLVGHNIGFDIKFLNNKMKNAKLNFNNKELIDTLPLSRRAFPKSNNHKLQTLVEYLGINTNCSHRALEDSKATLMVYTTSIKVLYNI